MTSFHVDPAALESAVGSIATSIDSLHADIARLTAQLRGLDAAWSGPAARAFATVVQDHIHASASGALRDDLRKVLIVVVDANVQAQRRRLRKLSSGQLHSVSIMTPHGARAMA